MQRLEIFISLSLSAVKLYQYRQLYRMPYQHIVIMKFKPTVGQDEIDSIFAALQNILDKKLIPGYIGFNGGAYESPEGLNKGFTHAFTVVFSDKESRDGYFPHPEHEVVKDMIVPRVDDVLCFDYAF